MFKELLYSDRIDNVLKCTQTLLNLIFVQLVAIYHHMIQKKDKLSDKRWYENASIWYMKPLYILLGEVISTFSSECEEEDIAILGRSGIWLTEGNVTKSK